ncbi:hypothetical protein BsWGS_19172 [Bradybaena similaris]
MNCFRILLHIFNIIFIILGITLVGIGIWTAAEKIYVSYVIGDKLFGAASYLIIAVGVFIIVVCIVGIIALWKDKRKLLVAYLCLLILSFLVLITAAALAIVFKGEVESVMVNSMRNSIINGYGKDGDITSAWDQMQSQLQCCAISETKLPPSILFNFPYVDGSSPKNLDEVEKQDSWAIYKRTQFYKNQLLVGENDRKYVPPSCCVYDNKLRDYTNVRTCQYFSLGPPVNYASGHHNDHLHYAGCYEKGKQFVLDQSDILVAIGFVFAFLMVAGMVLTFFIIRAIPDDVDSSKHRRRPNNVV